MYTARYLGAEGSGINPFRKSVYKTFRKSFIKKASRKMLRTAITKRNITLHARREKSPERDNISEKELVGAISNGEIIEDYHNDKPFPSCFIFGRTEEGNTRGLCVFKR